MNLPRERVIERKQGCWNCVHFDTEKGADLWWNEARAHMLHRAVEMAIKILAGENDQRVKNIRRMVVGIDEAITKKAYGCCALDQGDPENKVPNAKGNFVASVFLCEKWTGQQGASIARAGAAPDMLPQELQERFDVDRPANLPTWKGPLPGDPKN